MRKNIAFYPAISGVNKYSERMIQILGEGYNVRSLNLKKELFSWIKFKGHRNNDIAWLNWVENMLVHPKTGRLRKFGIIKLFLTLFILKVRFKKIIYVQHNIYPHNTNENDICKVKKIINLFTKYVDVTATHSPLSDNKFYIPHPLYDFPLKNYVNTKSDKRTYVIFGRIERYKKIESVITYYPDDINLIVVGSCDDSDYLDELKSISLNRKNIKIISVYTSDEEVEKIFSNCTGILICHSDPDMIVSGSCFYALTKQMPIIAIETPFLTWVEEVLGEKIVKTCSDIDDLISFIKNDLDSSGQGFSVEQRNIIDKLFGDKSILDVSHKITSL